MRLRAYRLWEREQCKRITRSWSWTMTCV
ncbi:hypothetical protein GRH90_17170 [Enterobacteriales bacterium SAP-6]|uniref:Uncharacterized protein n=1 Tax=Acerihabitans arboris TaxID=2691583 RepID=A0A845SNE2_9GAMM|nr:hypothetical protein [Acerihabitans arboris]